MTGFLVLADRRAIQVEKIVQISELTEQDIDARTGKYNRPIPEDARTRIDTVQGYFWTSVGYDEVIDQLLLIMTDPAVADG